MTGRQRILLVCTLLCSVLAAPVAGHVAGPGAADTAPQVTDPADQPDPEIFVNTTAVDFGGVDIGETGTAAVTVRNDGDGTLQVKDLELRGDDAFSLVLDESYTADTDGEIPTSPNFTLEPDESQEILLVFEPTGDERYDGTLEIDSDDPDVPTVEVDLSGDGIQPDPPEISLDRRSLSFENATVGEQSTRSVTVSNTGEGTLLVQDQRIQPAGGDYEILTPLDDAIGPGESDTLTVGFEPSTRNATSATLTLSTNAPNGTTAIYLSSTRASAEVSVDRAENTTQLTASVENATAGEPVSIAVPSDPDDPASTDIDSVSVTPARNGSFDLDVTSTDQRPAGASTFDAPDDTEPDELGYLNVSHSIPNEDISQATIQYRVNQSEMEELEAEPEDFSLYRRVNGSWERVNTTFEREANGTYLFSGTTTGLSEWTAATEVPRISVSDATANVTAVTLEESVEIRVLLNNTGGSDGRFEVELLQNGTVVERRDVAVSPETTSLVTFQRSFDQTGTYSIQVNDVFVAAIEVSEGEASVVEGGQATVGTAADSGSSGGPGLMLVGGAVFVVGLVAMVGFGVYRVVGGSSAGGGPADGADPSDGASAATAASAGGPAPDHGEPAVEGDAAAADEGVSDSESVGETTPDDADGAPAANEAAATEAGDADDDGSDDTDAAGAEAGDAGDTDAEESAGDSAAETDGEESADDTAAGSDEEATGGDASEEAPATSDDGDGTDAVDGNGGESDEGTDGDGDMAETDADGDGESDDGDGDGSDADDDERTS